MGHKFFFVIFLFSIFTCQQLHILARTDVDNEVKQIVLHQSEYFKLLEYELVIYADVGTFTPTYWGSVLITVEIIPNKYKKKNKKLVEFIKIRIQGESF